MAAKKKNDTTELKARLAKRSLDKLYVFYGEEEYLKEHYIKQILDMIPDAGLEEFNRIVISGRADYSVYDDAWEGMPMMTDRRALILRDSNIFAFSKKGDIVPPNEEQKEFWKEKFKRLSDDTVVIFCEKNVDGRSVLFKAAKKAGFTVECTYLSPSDLRAWVVRNTLKSGKKIDNSTADYLVSVVDKGLNNLENELNKLLNYCGGTIYKSDVDKVVSKALQVKIFDITDGIAEGNADKTLRILGEMRAQKESAFGILYLIYSNVEKMLRLRLGGAGSRREAAQLLGCSDWQAEKYLRGAAGFSEQALCRLAVRVPETDLEIKNGAVGEWQALEQYVFEALEMRMGRA